jgi:hypothetical protein
MAAIARYFDFAMGQAKSPQSLEQTYTLQSFEDRSAAANAARRNGVAALVRVADRDKWLLLRCPCGCGQQIALNLMHSHNPFWRIEVRSRASFSVHPSVDSTTCGAHFWLRDGRVIWCR